MQTLSKRPLEQSNLRRKALCVDEISVMAILVSSVRLQQNVVTDDDVAIYIAI
jgi:hypothetical protein